MEVELIVTGDEITRGQVADTNSAWLLSRLGELGGRARRVTAVGDVRADLRAAIVEATGRCDVVVCSGGLGPTSDDLTAEVVAALAGVALVPDPDTLERITTRWVGRGRPLPLPDRIAKQALVPAGCEVLANDEGTAPGFHVRLGRADCFFFAGVPGEFRHLCEQHLFPFLQARRSTVRRSRTLRCVGITEAELDAALLDTTQRLGVGLGLRAAFPEAHATFTAEAATSDAALALLDDASAFARGVLGPKIVSEDGATHAEVVARLCLAKGATLAVAESCTGGMLGAALTAIAGSSRWFLGGGITYSNEEKTRQLGVDPSLFASVGAVSEPVARAMAEGIRSRTGATHAVGITGVAGPGGGTPEKPVGTVWIALATPEGTSAVLHRFTIGGREQIRIAAVAHALDALRRDLLARAGTEDAT